MVGTGIILYSDLKILLIIDLNKGTYSLPILPSKTKIKEGIKTTLNIDIDDYETIKNKDSSLLAIIGDWEGNLKSNNSKKRLIWLKIKDAIQKTEGLSQKHLTFFKKSYVEIISEKGNTMGIAKREEAEKYSLYRKGTIVFLKKEDSLLLTKEKETYSSLFTINELGESENEAGYRILTEKDTITELKKEKEFINKNKIYFKILQGTFNKSLTFSNVLMKKSQFIAFSQLNSEKIRNKTDELTKEALDAYFEA